MICVLKKLNHREEIRISEKKKQKNSVLTFEMKDIIQ